MDNLYNLSSCPHVRSKLTTQGVMTDVLIALLPTAILGVVFHGFQAFLVIALSMCSAVVTEYLFNVVTKRKQTIYEWKTSPSTAWTPNRWKSPPTL